MFGRRARIGVLVPPGNPTVEPELYRMAPDGVSVHFARLQAPPADGPAGGAAGMEERTRAYRDGLDGGVARGNQDSDARPPAEHQAEPSGVVGGVAGSPTMRTKFATRAGLWKVPTRSVRTFTANSRERAFAYGRVVQIAS